MSNNTPTAPGFWYHKNQGILKIHVGIGGELFAHVVDYMTCHVGDYMTCTDVAVSDIDPDLWAGPVPMPGEWVPRGLFDDLWRMLYRINPAPGTPADNVLQAAKAWDVQNPAHEATQ